MRTLLFTSVDSHRFFWKRLWVQECRYSGIREGQGRYRILKELVDELKDRMFSCMGSAS